MNSIQGCNEKPSMRVKCTGTINIHEGFMNKLRLWHAHIQNANLSHFPTLKEIEMRTKKKTEFADQFEKLFNKFSSRFKDFKSHEHLFGIFSSPFHTDIDKAPTNIQMELIDLQERTELKAKYVEMNLGDFYRKYIDQDKFPNLSKFMASNMAFFGSNYLYVEMNLGDFYRKYLDQDKFPNLKKFMAFNIAFFGSNYLCEKFFSKMGFVKSPY